MSAYPRRSPRLSQQYGAGTPFSNNTPTSSISSSAYPSTLSTSHPSPTNEPPALAEPQHDQLRLQIQLQFLSAPQQSTAPLPSPSADQPYPFFSQLPSTSPFTMPQQSQQNGQPAQTSQQGAQHHNSFSQSQRPNMNPSSHVQGKMPPDFLAEAAKRAQMACLMRDLGDVTL